MMVAVAVPVGPRVRRGPTRTRSGGGCLLGLRLVDLAARRGEELDVANERVIVAAGAIVGLPLPVFEAPVDGHEPALGEHARGGFAALAEHGDVDVANVLSPAHAVDREAQATH